MGSKEVLTEWTLAASTESDDDSLDGFIVEDVIPDSQGEDSEESIEEVEELPRTPPPNGQQSLDDLFRMVEQESHLNREQRKRKRKRSVDFDDEEVSSPVKQQRVYGFGDRGDPRSTVLDDACDMHRFRSVYPQLANVVDTLQDAVAGMEALLAPFGASLGSCSSVCSCGNSRVLGSPFQDKRKSDCPSTIQSSGLVDFRESQLIGDREVPEEAVSSSSDVPIGRRGRVRRRVRFVNVLDP